MPSQKPTGTAIARKMAANRPSFLFILKNRSTIFWLPLRTSRSAGASPDYVARILYAEPHEQEISGTLRQNRSAGKRAWQRNIAMPLLNFLDGENMPPASHSPLEGGCACGAVRYRLETSRLFVNCCHCHWCQREAGASFALNALIESDQVTSLGREPELVGTPSASGKGQLIARCPVCHVAVWSHYAGSGPFVKFIRVGTLDQPDLLPPDIHIYTASKQPWVVLPEFRPYRSITTCSTTGPPRAWRGPRFCGRASGHTPKPAAKSPAKRPQSPPRTELKKGFAEPPRPSQQACAKGKAAPRGRHGRVHRCTMTQAPLQLGRCCMCPSPARLPGESPA
jgi:hypothetical protein